MPRYSQRQVESGPPNPNGVAEVTYLCSHIKAKYDCFCYQTDLEIQNHVI